MGGVDPTPLPSGRGVHMVRRQWDIVEVDGILADVGALAHFMEVLQPQPEEFGIPDSLQLPFTLKGIAEAVGFTALDNLVAAIRSHENFWEHAPTPLHHHLPDNIDPTRTIFHVVRIVTRGDPVLEQTIRWLRKYYEIPAPIVWWEEEEL